MQGTMLISHVGCYDCMVTNNVHAPILIINNNPITNFYMV